MLLLLVVVVAVGGVGAVAILRCLFFAGALLANESQRFYGTYVACNQVGGLPTPAIVDRNFLSYARSYYFKDGVAKKRVKTEDKTVAIGARFCFELLDNFIGQFCTLFFPHCSADAFHVQSDEIVGHTRCYYAAMAYLKNLRWAFNGDKPFLTDGCGASYAVDAFPLWFDGEPAISGRRLFALPDGAFHHSAAYEYLHRCMQRDLALRVGPERCETFGYRLKAVSLLHSHIYGAIHEDGGARRRATVAEWQALRPVHLTPRDWSQEQKAGLDAIAAGVNISDENALVHAAVNGRRFLYISGEPGSGKSEMLIHAAVAAAEQGISVLILCPTGALVHAYKDRLPESALITVETIHSGFAIFRKYDKVVEYNAPTRLRRYGLIIIDEASQIDNDVAALLMVGYKELPQRPFLAVAADFQQLNPIQGGSYMRSWCGEMPVIGLKSIFRTNDPVLLGFLSHVRRHQPTRTILRDFFAGRHLAGSLEDAVRFGLSRGQQLGQLFCWLCVTNPGAERVNLCALSLLGVTEELIASGFRGDPKAGAGMIYARPGLVVRLTRNLDKERGFVNGAIGVITTVLDDLGEFISL